ncbi:MAG: DUF4385 family protein [Haloarculaceae archaeon]
MSDETDEGPVRDDAPEVADGPEYDLDLREHPGRDRHTPDERGAFKVEPYKSELLPLWGISTLEAAETGAADIYDRYCEYREDDPYEQAKADHRERYGE